MPSNGRSRSGIGSAPRAPSRSRAVRLSRPRRAPHGEGLPLLRHRPDDAGHAVRGRPRRLRPARRRVRSSGATRSSRRTAPGPVAAFGRSSSAAADYEPIYGGEAVRLDGDVVGRLRSVAYGPTIERTIGYAYLPAIDAEGAASRSTCSTGVSPPSSPPTSSSTPPATGCVARRARERGRSGR